MINKDKTELYINLLHIETEKLESGFPEVDITVDDGFDYHPTEYLSLEQQKQVIAFLQENVDKWESEEGREVLRLKEEERKKAEELRLAESKKPKKFLHEIEYIIGLPDVNGDGDVTFAAKVWDCNPDAALKKFLEIAPSEARVTSISCEINDVM